MTSIGQTDGNSRLASMHPAIFSNALSSNYRERYMMEMQASSHHGRSTFNRNGSTMSHNQQQQQSTKESSSSVWQQRQVSGSDIKPHHHSPEENNMRGGGGGGSSSRAPTSMLRSPDSINRGSPASLQSSSRSSEQYDTTGTAVVRGGDLQQFVEFVDSGVRYSSLVPPTSSSGNPLQQQHSNSGGGVNEGAMIRELIGRLGGSSMGSSNGDSLMPTSPITSQCSAGGVENLAVVKLGGGNHGSWNSASAAAVEITSNVSSLAVDSSKGGVSVNRVAVGGLTTSRCLSPFSADPGFAERAARFSSFSNGNYAQPFSSTSECGVAAKIRSRSRAALLSESSSKHLAGVTSSSPLLQESAANLNSSGSRIPSELLLDSVIREAHSGRGISYDIGLLAPGADENHHDDNSAEANYGQIQGTPAVSKLLCRTASNLLVAKKHPDEEEEEETQGRTTTTTTSADASSNPGKIRGISASSVEQASSPGPREACPSSGGSSAVTNICVKKRKTSLDDRPPNKDVGSVSASSQGERDAKIPETEEAKAKRFRCGEGSKEKEEMRSKTERSSSETSGETSPRSSKDISKSSEPPKPDYIHVRARRGQATDSHSLAERVRREKISERMKFLQDLVPGCSKVTGKAVMLDEIINYVQSLQRQVEFLSMKLASVNPRSDFNLETFLGKEGTHPGGSQSIGFGSETSIPYPPMHPQQHQAQLQQGWDYQLHSETTLRRSMRLNVAVPVVLPARIDGFGDGVGQTSMWDDGELQSIVQMGIGHTP